MPPIDVYRIGELHFVKDGHHRVSVARALGLDKIDAYVTEVITRVGADRKITPRRPAAEEPRAAVLRARAAARARPRKRIQLKDPRGYAFLAEGVEAWGFRAMQARGEFMDREEVARGVVLGGVRAGGRDAARGRRGHEGRRRPTPTWRRSRLRYMLLTTHEWDEEVLERVREQIEHPSWEDTQIRKLRKDLR